jgi:hypothetical protein
MTGVVNSGRRLILMRAAALIRLPNIQLRALLPVAISLEHMRLQRALLPAHLERPEPALRDAGRERGGTVEQGRGRQHAIVGLAARLLDPRACVHRVAAQRDLLLW